MLGDITAADEIYIVTGRTDMRKSIDGKSSNMGTGYEKSPHFAGIEKIL